jgi:F-type H+-transporting ATPase subunit b
MKKWLSAAAIFAAALFPTIALAAEEAAPEQGSWLVLMFFAINFTLFAFVIVRFAVPPMRKFFADRAATIRSGLSRAQSAFAEAQDMANRAASKMAALEAEAKALAAELDGETEFQVRRIVEAAAAASERVLRDTELTAAAIADAAAHRVRERLADAASSLARDLVARQFQSADQSRLLDGFMDQLGAEARR